MFYSQIINKFICECDYISYNIEKIFDIPVLISNDELLSYELENLINSFFRDDKIEFNTKCEIVLKYAIIQKILNTFVITILEYIFIQTFIIIF